MYFDVLSWDSILALLLESPWFYFGLFLFLAASFWLLNVLVERWRDPIPSPFPFPIVKHFPYLAVSHWRGGAVEMISRWANVYKKYGFFKINLLLGERIVVIDRDFTKYLFLSPNTKYSRNTELFVDMVPNLKGGLFVADGKDHAQQKKLLNPLFTQSAIEAFTDCFNRNAERLVKKWAKSQRASSVGIPVQDDLNSTSLDIIGECAFGFNFDALEAGENDIRDAFKKILDARLDFFTRAVKNLFPIFKVLPLSRFQADESLQVASKVVQNIIKHYKEQVEYDHNEDRNLLATLVNAQDKDTGFTMSDEVLSANVFTFLVAGHETTSTALMWALYCLAANPDKQRKVREEIQSVLNGTTAVITQEHCMKMPYLTAVINESLRLHPAVPTTIRKALVNDCYKGMYIKKGTVFIVVPMHLQNDPSVWDCPKEFRPERFLNGEDVKMQRQFSFLPFASGPLMCIGWRLAMMELKVVLAKLLNSLDFNLADDAKFTKVIQLTSKAKPPIQFKITQLINCM